MKYLVCFLVGGGLYVVLELFWRGHSHISMAAAGGVSLTLMYGVFTRYLDLSALAKCVIGGVLITSVEFLTGYFVNLRGGLKVWDYSDIPYNLYGQICFRYTLLGAALTMPASVIVEIVYTSTRL
jgi:uncharacterized membrane protein